MRPGPIFVTALLLATLPAYTDTDAEATGRDRSAATLRLDTFSLRIVSDTPTRVAGSIDADAAVATYRGGALPGRPVEAPLVYSFEAGFDLPGTLAGRQLALYLGIAEYPFTVYLNGREVAARGRHEGQYNSSLRAAMAIHLPADLIRQGDRANRIVIEAYPRFETWGLDMPYIGSAEDVAWAVFWRNFFGINLVQATFILSLVMVVYVFALYLLESKRRTANLYFVAIGISYCLAYLNVVIHNEAIPEVPLEALSKAGMVLASTFLVAFIVDFTGIITRPRLRPFFFIALFAAGGAAGIAILVQNDKEGILRVFSAAMNFLILPELVFNTVVIGHTVFRKKTLLVLPLLGAIVVVLATAAHDMVFLNSYTLPYAWLTPYGYFAYVLAIFAILAAEQGILYRKTVRQTRELLQSQERIEQLNQELTLQRDSFFRFVPTQFLQLLGKDSALQIQLGDSSLRYLSVLFSDIRRYTGISEGMLPDQILRFLNEYLIKMEWAIQQNNGFVDKYIGDAILALFYHDEFSACGKSMSADIALKAATEMDGLLEEYNSYARTKGRPTVEIGIGVNSGEVVLGTVGSESRLDTTVLGDTVNVSSRLESLTKHYGVRYLVSEHTRNALMRPESFNFREVDYISVAGRSAGLRVSELLNPETPYGRMMLDSRDDYETAHSLVAERRFSEAASVFGRLCEAIPADRVSALHRERNLAYVAAPPPENWDGVFRFNSK